MNKQFFSFIVITAIFAATFTSCSKDNKDPDVSAVSGTISGEHADWTVVNLSFDYGNTWAATAPISNGRFSIKLPVPEAQYLEPIVEDGNFPVGVTISDESATGCVASFFVCKDTQAEMLSLMSVDMINLSVSAVQYLYVAKDVNASGSLSEEGMEIIVDMKLKKGWNTVILTTSLGGTTMTLKNGNIPSNAVWVAATSALAVSPVETDEASFNVGNWFGMLLKSR
jgi:hypothetical protein